MILHKLSIRNFRQFYGEQEIVFAGVDGPENVTVVFGQNGRGKTGIFRAIMFCLYGDVRLSQDEGVNEKELSLVNLPALSDAEKAGNKDPVECSVTIDFSHRGESYTLTRGRLAMQMDGKVIEEAGQVRINKVDRNGNCKVHAVSDEIDNIINGILNSQVREYFLVDGEKIEKLTKASSEQKKAVAKGVRSLLQIDALEMAINAIKSLKRNLDKELEKRATGEYAKILHKIAESEGKLETIDADIQSKDNQLEKNSIEKNSIDNKLKEYEEVKDLLNKRTLLEVELYEKKQQSKGIMDEIKISVSKVASLLVSDVSEEVYGLIDEMRKNGQIPSEIRRDLIEKILHDKRCICGRDVDSGNQAHTAIMVWLNKTENQELQDNVIDLWRYLGGVVERKNDILGTADVLLQKIAVNTNDIERFMRQIESIKNEIGHEGSADAAKLDKYRETLESDYMRISSERIALIRRRDELKLEIDILANKRKDAAAKEGIKNEISDRSDLAKNAIDALKQVYEDFTAETRERLSRFSSEYFRKLLDSEGKQTLHDIVVNEDYSLQIHDIWGKPFLANISAGQRQIMSVAFIAALAKVASGKDFLEMPLFMDTPFGRLSFGHRENLLKFIPTFTRQWVLLVTDTELRRREAASLKATHQWGKFYTLETLGAGKTYIRQRQVNEYEAFMVEDGA